MCVFNFMHGCSNYGLVKTEIDVMMLFKFEVKYVELNFKAIALMEFSFDNNSIYHVHMVVIYS